MQNSQKIAIIEDEPALLEMYRLKLEMSGFEVVTAENGKQGLEVCKLLKPDLILLDIKMPVMSGDEMLEELRKTEWGAQIRVIILTNISKDEAPQSLRFLNVDLYIVKAHYTPTQIVEQVKRILHLK